MVMLQALRNLVLLVGSLTTCGYEQIDPAYDSNSVFKLDNFTVPKPLGKGRVPVYMLIIIAYVCVDYGASSINMKPILVLVKYLIQFVIYKHIPY